MRSGLRVVLSTLLLASTVLTGCGGGVDKKTGTTPSPYAKGNYPGHLKIGNPYDISGRTYYPAHDPSYVEEGIASWYGPGFHGRSTANGERFDQNALTAAHRTLPMPSIVRVTNLENGKTAVLTVNDRGPFAKDRIIDLSKRAATDLGVIANGTARVRVEYMERETRQLIAGLIRNNELKADSTTLAMLGMSDLERDAAANTALASVKPAPSRGLIASANAAEPAVAEPVYASSQRGVVERAPLSPVQSRQLTQPEHYPQEAQHARVERRAAEPTPAVPYERGGVVPRTMPSNPRQLTAPPPATAPSPTPQIESDQWRQDEYAPPPVDLQPMPREVLQREQPAPQSPAARPAAAGNGIFVQVGAFSQEQNAHDLSRRLAGLGRTIVKPVDANGRTWYRVRLGPIHDASTANQTLQQVKAMGLSDAHMVRD